MNDFNKEIWAYLHDELAPEKRERFEQALAGDPALREALAERQATHQQLEAIGQEQLEAELLAEWEAAHPQFREPASHPHGRIIRFILPLAAAAAAVILLTALPRGPVHWQRTDYGSIPQLRGAALEARYTRNDFKQLASELQRAVEQRVNPASDCSLRIHLQELTDGALTIEINGRAQYPTWYWSFQSLDAAHKAVPEMAQQIAAELVP